MNEEQEKEFEEELKTFYTEDFVKEVNFDPIKSFISRLLSSQRKYLQEKVLEEIEDALELYFISQYPIPDAKVIMGYLRGSLTKEQ